jgi:TrmH family RNA methyltransferase
LRSITSSSNALCRHVRKLLENKRYRRECGEFVLEGRRLWEDALLSGLSPRQVLLSEQVAEESLPAFEAVCSNVCILSESALRACGDTVSPQGLVALFPFPERRRDTLPRKSVLLCSLQDPGNVGMIIRTAEAFGLEEVMASADCPDFYAPKVLRATMGGVFRMPVRTVEHAEEMVSALQAEGVPVYAAALCESARPLAEIDLTGDCCLLIGNEGNGLPKELVARCNGALAIPMSGKAQSLNAAMAAGIFIYEMTR